MAMSISTDEELDAAIPRDDELEAVVAELITRKNTAREGSTERLMAVRQLDGLRRQELAALYIEELDPYAWGR
jgi:hypothetical protein